MTFLQRVLDPPAYGWQDSRGNLVKPSRRQLLEEWLRRVNPSASPRNWLPFAGWMWTLLLLPSAVVFFARYFSWPLLALGFVYGMVGLGTFGTVWLHRYGTHRAFSFRNPVWRFLFSNLAIKVVPEETYVVSHHVHHAYAEQPGDPYNVDGGALYCFLADTNHQQIAKDLSAADYQRVVRMLDHTGMRTNSHEKYRFWGSVSHPLHLTLQYLLNWAFWYGAFYLIGGHALACAMFGGAFFWAVGIRTYNFSGHGSGKDARRDGIDFNRADRSVNQLWPGLVAGEWHNNHHLYRRSARTGFLRYQLDLAYIVIRVMKALGGVHGIHDDRERFLREHREPYLRARALARAAASRAATPARAGSA